MSAKHRCHTCRHKPGPRSLGRVVKETNATKKAPCGCACHTRKDGEV